METKLEGSEKAKEKEEGAGILDDVKGFFGLKNREKGTGSENDVEDDRRSATTEYDTSSESKTEAKPVTTTQGVVFKVQDGDVPNAFPGSGKIITRMEKVPVEVRAKKAGLPTLSEEDLKATIAR